MIKWAKVVNEETKQCEVGIGTNEKFYRSIGMQELDVEQSYKGGWYLVGHAPQKPQREDILEQISLLEHKITERNLRGAIIGDSFAINKINEIESQIAQLRQQLEGITE